MRTRRDRREGQEHRRKGWGEHRKDKAVLSREFWTGTHGRYNTQKEVTA